MAMETAYRKVCGNPGFYLCGRVLQAGITHVIDTLEREEQVCSFCVVSLRKRQQKGERAAWKDLPKLLGVEVEGWDQNAA